MAALLWAAPALAMPPGIGLDRQPTGQQVWALQRAGLGVQSHTPPDWLPTAIAPSEGTAKILVVPIAFSDVAAQAPSSDRNYWNDLFFGEDDDQGPYPYPSVRAYYADQSFGALSITGKVLDWTTSAFSEKFLANMGGNKCYGLGVDGNFNGGLAALQNGGASTLVQEALQYAINQGENLDDYDNDGDGVIDGVIVVHSGRSAEMQIAVSADEACDMLWSHQAQGSFDLQINGVTTAVDVLYVVGPERFYCPEALCGSGEAREYPAGIGIFVHEFGHTLGLPDLYGVTGYGVGRFSLMAWGLYTWNGAVSSAFGPDAKPAPYDPWSCEVLGWCKPAPVADNLCRESLSPLSTGTEVLRVDLDDAGLEYYLIAYRGNDPWLSLGANGVEIWHIDDRMAEVATALRRNPAACIPDEQDLDSCADSHYWVSIEQADGLFELEKSQDALRGNADDLWQLFDNFRPSATPSSCAWDASNCQTTIGVRTLLSTQADVRVIVDPDALPPEPQFLTIPSGDELRARTGRPYVYEPKLLSGQSDDLRFRLASAPRDMTVDPQTGRIEWIPPEAGVYDVVLIAENCASDTSQAWTIVVSDGGGGGCSAASGSGDTGWSILLALLCGWMRTRGRRATIA